MLEKPFSVDDITAILKKAKTLRRVLRCHAHRLLKLGDKGVAEAPRLEAWTSAITADAHRSGLLVTHRWDLLLGPSAHSGRGARPCLAHTLACCCCQGGDGAIVHPSLSTTR